MCVLRLILKILQFNKTVLGDSKILDIPVVFFYQSKSYDSLTYFIPGYNELQRQMKFLPSSHLALLVSMYLC